MEYYLKFYRRRVNFACYYLLRRLADYGDATGSLNVLLYCVRRITTKQLLIIASGFEPDSGFLS